MCLKYKPREVIIVAVTTDSIQSRPKPWDVLDLMKNLISSLPKQVYDLRPGILGLECARGHGSTIFAKDNSVNQRKYWKKSLLATSLAASKKNCRMQS